MCGGACAVHVRCACSVHAQCAHLRQRVAHVPRAHAQLDRGGRLVAAVLEHRVRRPGARGFIREVEAVAVERLQQGCRVTPRGGRERHVQPAVALALGLLLLHAEHILHAEGRVPPSVPLMPHEHEVAAGLGAADLKYHPVALARTVPPPPRTVFGYFRIISDGGGPAKVAQGARAGSSSAALSAALSVAAAAAAAVAAHRHLVCRSQHHILRARRWMNRSSGGLHCGPVTTAKTCPSLVFRRRVGARHRGGREGTESEIGSRCPWRCAPPRAC